MSQGFESTSVRPLPTSAEDITTKIREILREINGIHDEVSAVIMTDAGLKGENFASDTSCVTVKFANPKLKSINLFVKVEVSSESNKELLAETKFFEKEALFFTKYIPAVREFLKNKGQEHLLEIYPKCYYADTKLVILEHLLLDRGFELLDKRQKQGLALSTLAKHHAISYVYIQTIGGTVELIKRFPNIEFEAFAAIKKQWEEMVEISIRTCIQILSKSSAEGKEEAITDLQAKQGIVWEFLMKVQKPEPNSPLLVLNHGDYWNNNMLFRRNTKTNALEDQVAIDFQAVRIDSPGADLGFYLFSTLRPEVRQTRLKELLTVYLEAFNETCAKLDHPIVLTYEELYHNYRKRLDYGFWFFGVWAAPRLTYDSMEQITSVDASQWATVYSKSVQKWIESNPVECEEDAKEIVKLMKEYKSLTLIQYKP